MRVGGGTVSTAGEISPHGTDVRHLTAPRPFAAQSHGGVIRLHGSKAYLTRCAIKHGAIRGVRYGGVIAVGAAGDGRAYSVIAGKLDEYPGPSEAHLNGCTIVNISKAGNGGVMAIYDLGSKASATDCIIINVTVELESGDTYLIRNLIRNITHNIIRNITHASP